MIERMVNVMTRSGGVLFSYIHVVGLRSN